jgi:C4-dicarboxylate transporter DctQ subunit
MEKSGTIGGRLSRVFDRILVGTGYASGAIIIIMMLSMSYDVVMRYFFNAPTRWAGDFSGYMQYVLVLIGAAWVLMIRGHTRIDILVTRFSPRTQKIMSVVTSFIALIACALFVWVGIRATWLAYQGNEFLYRDIQVPLYPLYAVIPFSFLLIFIQFGRMAYSGWRSLQTGISKEQSKPG